MKMATSKKKILLSLTAYLILFTFLKAYLGTSDIVDRIVALLAVIVFFADQLTR